MDCDVGRFFFSSMKSPIGDLLLVAGPEGLRQICFHAQQLPAAWTESAEELGPYREQLSNYFEGQLREFTCRLELIGTPFQLRCWQALRNIPYGETRSYAEIAQQVGSPRAFRAVGQANHCNPIPIVVPCHRVIAADGTLAGYGGGLAIKEKLLRLEGWPAPSHGPELVEQEKLFSV